LENANTSSGVPIAQAGTYVKPIALDGFISRGFLHFSSGLRYGPFWEPMLKGLPRRI